MIVRRTPSGETNKRLFLGVEAIVYVEGGQPLSPSQVRAGQYAREAMDIRFWESLFECFWQGGELEFRAIGCKDTLLSLADDIIEGRVANVVVAMDRDHDEFKCALKKTHNVLYTYAYSWEGDVWSRVVVSEVFYALAPVSKSGIDASLEVEEAFGEFRRGLRWPVYADILLSLQGDSLLPRHKPERIIEVEKTGRPRIGSEELIKLVRQKRDGKVWPLRANVTIKHDTMRNCAGHIVAAYCYRVVTYLLKKFTKSPTISKQFVEGIAIEKFKDWCLSDDSDDRAAYYAEVLGRIRI